MKISKKQIIKMYKILSLVEATYNTKLPWLIDNDIKELLKEIDKQQSDKLIDINTDTTNNDINKLRCKCPVRKDAVCNRLCEELLNDYVEKKCIYFK